MGLAVGEPVPDEEDLHGMAVVIASRLCSEAGAGEVLVQDLVAALVASRNGVAFQEARAFELRGVAEPVRALSLRWRELALQEPRAGEPAAGEPAGAGGRSRRGSLGGSEQRAHLGAAFIGITGLCVIPTIVAVASHNFKLSSPAAIGLFSLGAICLLVALWAFGLFSGTVTLGGCVMVAVIGLAVGLSAGTDATQTHTTAHVVHGPTVPSPPPGHGHGPGESDCPPPTEYAPGTPCKLVRDGRTIATVVLRYSLLRNMTWGKVTGLGPEQKLRIDIHSTPSYVHFGHSNSKGDTFFQEHGCMHSIAVTDSDGKALARKRIPCP